MPTPDSLSDLIGAPLAPALAGIIAAWAVIEIAGGWIGAKHRRHGLRRWLLWSVVGGVAAGRAVHVITSWEGFAGQPLKALAFWQGGLSGQAAMVVVLVITAVALGRCKANFAPTLWAAGAGLAVGWGVALMSGGGGLPDLTHRYETLDGQGFDLASEFAAGRPVVLNLWTTWCGPCRRELPLFQEALQGHPDITFAFASQREPARRVALFMVTGNLRLPNVIFDTDGLLGRHYAGFGIPTTLFIAPDGIVKALHVGEISRARLEAETARLKPTR